MDPALDGLDFQLCFDRQWDLGQLLLSASISSLPSGVIVLQVGIQYM